MLRSEVRVMSLIVYDEILIPGVRREIVFSGMGSGVREPLCDDFKVRCWKAYIDANTVGENNASFLRLWSVLMTQLWRYLPGTCWLSKFFHRLCVCGVNHTFHFAR